MRNSGLLRRLPNATRNFVDNHVVVRRIPPQQAANTNDGIVFLCLRKRARGNRYFKRPRHPHQRNIFFLGARTHQPIVSALKKPLCNKRIEARDNDRKAFPSRAKPALDSSNSRLGRPLDFDLLFRSLSP